jgi:beta-lactam-binding protein with PASTA domain
VTMCRTRLGTTPGLGGAVLVLAGCSAATSSTPSPTHEVVVPNLGHGYPVDIENRLCAAGLNPRVMEAPAIVGANTGVNGYSLVSASPAAGARVAAGSVVDLYLAVSVNAGGMLPNAGAQSVIPNVVGVDVNAALNVLTQLGFSVDVSSHTPTGQITVTEQSPAAGTTLADGGSVTLKAGPTNGVGCPQHS